MPQLQTNRNLLKLIKLRYLFILLQFLAILLAEFLFEYKLPYLVLKAIVAVELALNMGLYWYYRSNRNIHDFEYFVQILLDVSFLTLLLFFSGGATNPFVSLLLLPVAIAAVTLKRGLLIAVTLLAFAAYTLLLLSISAMEMHHVDIHQHFVGMWVNFALSAMVVVLIVASLVQAMHKQDRYVSRLREEQLRQEQLVALGTISAQFVHHLATPLGTASLLAEELAEQLEGTNQKHVPGSHGDKANDDSGSLMHLRSQLALCSKRLQDFRAMAEEVKQNQQQQMSLLSLFDELKEEIQLNFPDMQVQYELPDPDRYSIQADTTLLPAILNLVQNAVQASRKHLQERISLSGLIKNNQLLLSIRDYGSGISEDNLLQLGSRLVESDKGLGMGVLLSHATLERFAAELKLYNHSEGGAVAEVAFKVA